MTHGDWRCAGLVARLAAALLAIVLAVTAAEAEPRGVATTYEVIVQQQIRTDNFDGRAAPAGLEYLTLHLAVLAITDAALDGFDLGGNAHLEDGDGFSYPVENLTPQGGQTFAGARHIAPGEPSFGQLVFLVPAGGSGLALVVTRPGEPPLAITLDGSGGPAGETLPAKLLAGPVTKAGLTFAVEDFSEPGADGAAQLTLWMVNAGDSDLRANVGSFILLVEDGRFGLAPAKAEGAGFANEAIFPPHAPRHGLLKIQLPPDPGELSLVVFTAEGLIRLPLTPGREARTYPVATGPVASSALVATLRSFTGPEGGGNRAVADLDVGFAGTANMMSVDFNADYISLLTSDGQRLPVELPPDLRRPFRPVALWTGQPLGGEVAFTIPAGLSLDGAAVVVDGTDPPIRLPVAGGTSDTGPVVTPPPALASLALIAATAEEGRPIGVRFEGFPGSPQDWLSLATEGSPDDKYLQTINVNGVTSGSVVFNSVVAGRYEIRAYFNWPDGGYAVQARLAVTVGPRKPVAPGSLIAVPRPAIAEGDPLAVQWRGFPGFDADWIAVARRDQEDNSDGVNYFHLHGQKDGRLLFNGLSAGDYEVRAYFNNERVVQDRLPVTVTARSATARRKGFIDDAALPGLSNVAHRARGALLQMGQGAGAINDGDAVDYAADEGFQVLDPSTANRIWLARPYAIDKLRFLLWDVAPRNYRYRIEGSPDGVTWEVVSDHSINPVAGGWQEVPLGGRRFIAFQFRDAAAEGDDTRVRVVEFAALTAEALAPLPELALPDGSAPEVPAPARGEVNVAVDAFGATLAASSNSSLAIDGYHDTSDGAVAGIGENIVLTLGQPTRLDRLRLDLGSQATQKYAYTVETSADGETWTQIADRRDTLRNGIDEIAVKGAVVKAVRVTPTALSLNSDRFTLVEIEAITAGNAPAAAIGEPIDGAVRTGARNVALSLHGGFIAAQTSERAPIHGAANLIDGTTGEDWISRETAFPEEIVIGFGNGGKAAIDAVDFYRSGWGAPARLVELAVTEGGADGKWVNLGRFGLRNAPVQRVGFPAVTAQAIRIRMISGYAESAVAWGEIAVREVAQSDGPSVLPDRYPGFRGGLNIAAVMAGGRIVAAGPAEDDPNYGPPKVNDGLATGGYWAPDNDLTPPQVTFAFHGDRLAQIAGLAFNPNGGHSNFTGDSRWTSTADLWTSSSIGVEDFVWRGRFRLDQVDETQVFSFAPVAARRARIVLVDTFGSTGAVIGEIEVLEDPVVPSILTDAPPNPLDYRYGGNVAVPAGVGRSYLIDSSAASDGWYDESGARPVELTFGFRDSRPLRFDGVALNPRTSLDPVTWARHVKVLVSDHPLLDFHLVGEFDLAPEDRLQTFAIAPVTARYLQVRLITNGGDKVMSLGEVAVHEALAPGEVSAMARTTAPLTDETVSADEPPPEELTGDDREAEPNDTREQANPLAPGRRMSGAIKPLNDVDWFSIAPAMPPARALDVTVEETPRLRSELELYAEDGRRIANQPLYDLATSRADFTWLIHPGRHFAKLSRAENSIVFIVDRSGSVSSVRRDIAGAAAAFAENAAPDEAISFAAMDSDFVYNDFTTDKAILAAAAAETINGEAGSGVYESISHAIDRLQQRKGAKAIVIVTDGEDSGSSMEPLFDLWAKLRGTGTRVYTVGFGPMATNQLDGLLGSTGGDMLRNFSAATGGRYFYAPRGEAMAAIYARIAADLRGQGSYRLAVTSSSGEGALAVTASGEPITGVSAPHKVALIFDASGSMKKKLAGGETRIAAARAVLHQVIDRLPPATEVALRVYGHRLPSKPHDQSCLDTELVVPFQPLDPPRLHAIVDAIKPRGETPIGRSLALLADDFGDDPSQHFAILVTDGEESCDPDPADPFYPPSVIRDLKSRGIDLRVSIVGFAIGDAAVRQFLADLAESTGGGYFDAGNQDELATAIDEAFSADVVAADSLGQEAGRGKVNGPAMELPEGRWNLRLDSTPAINLGIFRVEAGGTTTLEVHKEGDRVEIKVR